MRIFRQESTIGCANRSAVSQHWLARDKRQLVANSMRKRELPSNSTVLGSRSETNTLRENATTVDGILSVWGDNFGKRLRSILVTPGALSKPLGLSNNLEQFPSLSNFIITVVLLLGSLSISGCVAHELEFNKNFKEENNKVMSAADKFFDRFEPKKGGN